MSKAKKTKFKWTIEIEVDKVWIQDGFDPDAEQIKYIFLRALGFAQDGEVKVKVVERPSDRDIATAQGYKTVRAYRRENWFRGERR